MSNQTEFGQLVDCTEDEFKKYCEDKDVGYLSSFHNLMVQMYNEVQGIKDELVRKIAKDSHTREQAPEEKFILEGLYSKMLRIEQRVFILRDLIKDRAIS